MNFPILYKKTSTGADQMWCIFTTNNIIYTQWGQVDGVKQLGEEVIKEGKNIGRSNQTSPTQQAESEALSQWENKLKKGYVKDLAIKPDGKRTTMKKNSRID